MGIFGLTSYVKQNFFLKDYDLCNTTLVIDGNSVIAQIYTNSDCNYCFGGEFMEYSFYVSEFFDELLLCNVTPIIIFDGGIEEKKRNTIVERLKLRIFKVALDPSSQPIVYSSLTKSVFINLAKKRNIKVIQTIFEADHHIASLAKILNCPVLSLDSDFLIYDVVYIPFDTLKFGVKSNANGIVKQCKVFDRERFFQEYPKLNNKLFSLAAAVLGNDYIKSNVFDKFFSNLKITKIIAKKYETNQCHLKIIVLLKWLEKHTFISAVANVLSKLDLDKQKSVLKTIQMVIDDYLNPSEKILKILGYTQEQIDKLMQKINYESITYQDITNIELDQETCDDNEINFYESIEYVSKEHEIFEPELDENIEKIVPTWFLNIYNNTSYPSYFIDMLNKQHIFTALLIEDISEPSSFKICLKIVCVIFQLLSCGTTNANLLKYTNRGNGNQVKIYESNCNDYKLTCKIPRLNDLTQVSLSDKKKIFLTTLGVTDKYLVKFPPKWRLYLAVIKYWFDESEKKFTTSYHIYALLMLIIFNVIKNMKMKKNFKQYETFATNIKDIDTNKSLKEAFDQVSFIDCENDSLIKFFETKKIEDKKNKFDITTVNAFSLLQNCLNYTIDLNSLLDYVYPTINVGEFYSGIMIYNLFNDFKNHKKLNARVCAILEKSPSILQLFISLSKETLNMLKSR